MKKLLVSGGIAASILIIPFGGPVWPDGGAQQQIATSVPPPVWVDNSFIIPVEGDPGDRW